MKVIQNPGCRLWVAILTHDVEAASLQQICRFPHFSRIWRGAIFLSTSLSFRVARKATEIGINWH